jgi:hypothetical protein
MRLLIVFPDTKIINGNMVTTSRWKSEWTTFDIEVLQLSVFLEHRDDLVFDQLIILHARKCAKIVDSNTILVLSGTDLSSLCAISKRSIAIAKKVVSLRPLTESEQSNIHREVTVITQGREQMQRCPPRQNETLRVVIIANDRPEKNLDILPIVCANLKVPITIIVIGASDRLEYFNNVPQIIHLGCQSPQAATEAILQADVILCPSHSEGMSDVFVQAVCSSSPILCSLIPPTQYVLTENYAGMFLSNDVQQLVSLLIKCVESPTFLQELSKSVASVRGKLLQLDETKAWVELLSS